MKSNLGKLNSVDLYTRVKAGFLLQGTSLNRWCVENGIHRQNAAQALKGLWKGEKSNLLKEKIISASGITSE
ncbi:hypothetical protein VIVU109783_19655 [Vibrio vulnificus]|uniref:hypothetical protein n=1 Tax=Vibrio vulnificus TaxID=672 RepID=UPI0005C3D547|nr:hypothetical protein [Vibrio vulnificus]MDG3059675.1 hypothetical protein [Vibrio parahaemolyticus]PWY30107.1 hypothetical protein VV86_21440 [Vibrio vulnificus]HDY7838315.1 hypothetical protein [Vibrio vulnificus]